MTSDRDRPVLLALNAVALLLVASPAIDFIGSILPLHPAEVSWRFGAFGLFTNALVTPILGLALMLFVAMLLDRRKSARGMAAVMLILTVVLVLGLGLFALDYLQLRRAVSSASQGAYDTAAIKALLNGFVEGCVLVWLVVTGFRTGGSGQVVGGGKRHHHRERVGLVVQTPEDEGR